MTHSELRSWAAVWTANAVGHEDDIEYMDQLSADLADEMGADNFAAMVETFLA